MELIADIPIEYWQKYGPPEIEDMIQQELLRQFLNQKIEFNYDVFDFGHHKVAKTNVEFAVWNTGDPEIEGEHSKNLLLDFGDCKYGIGFKTLAGSWRQITPSGVTYVNEPRRWMVIPD